MIAHTSSVAGRFGADMPLLAQGASPSGPAGLLGSPLLMIVVMFGIFYFLLILPSQRRQKKTAEMLQSLKSGDKVITTGGIYGTIVGLDNESVQLRIAEQVKVRVARSAIAGLQRETQES